jgi:hypothetical protein
MTSLRTELAVGLTQQDTPTLLRRGVLVLAWLGLAGTTTELIFLRHWASATQLIAWPFVAVLGVAAVLVSARPTARSIVIVRWLAVAVVVASVVGVGLHIVENLDAGPLDRDYASIWASMSVFDQWWAAITGGVGPAPVLAPGALAEISLALLLATVRHPALGTGWGLRRWWRARRDSNSRPSGPQPDALSTELRAHAGGEGGIRTLGAGYPTQRFSKPPH